MLITREKLWRRSALAVLLLLVTTFSVIQLGSARHAGGLSELRTVLEVIALLKTHYVDPLDALDLVGAYIRTGDIDGMLSEALDDPYTHYMNAEAFEQTQLNIEGSFGGIGIVVGIQDGQLTIVAPIDNTPGHRAGLRGGDRILAVDGRSTESLSLNEAVSLMRGPEGTTVRLLIERTVRDEVELIEVEIVRAIVEVDSVSKTLVIEPSEHFPFLTGRMGYIRISNFSLRTDSELRQALHSAVHEHRVNGIILDLRDNPGGVFRASLEVANQFIPDGPLVHIVGRSGEPRSYHAYPDYAVQGLPPLVVLVNQHSASASEIVAGALQDRGRAVIVGESTYGKGLVQTIFPLQQGALSVTTDRYQTAGGRFIHEEGIAPDVVVEWPMDERLEATYLDELGGLSPDDPQLRTALEILQGYLDQEQLAQAS